MVLAETADRCLQLRIDLGRAAVGPAVAILEPSEALGEVPLAVAVVGLPGDAVAPADLGHCLAGPFGLHEHREP
jgi:hypothetical protein